MLKSIETRFANLGYWVFWQTGADGRGYYIQAFGTDNMKKIAGNKDELEEWLIQHEEANQ